MKIITTLSVAMALFITSNMVTAGPLTAEREARMLRIEALTQQVTVMRKSRSSMIENQLKVARLQAEIRKEARQLDRLRDKAAALRKRGL
ncbi:hypothetical protein [Leucothrix pacifica]|uniref:YbgF trimerisation domain-containing protein n=1 Tax=Leucothrix pacifica TaxID=1247513 RepID=A0A317C1Y1_9GAMM|nr:hypothetical protein [Leucothrix pacifica]PWQ92369.1 hypothetical protein DKW60_21360 [Leucothrix pacifica]